MSNLVGGIILIICCVFVFLVTLFSGKIWTKFLDDIIEKGKKNQD